MSGMSLLLHLEDKYVEDNGKREVDQVLHLKLKDLKPFEFDVTLSPF